MGSGKLKLAAVVFLVVLLVAGSCVIGLYYYIHNMPSVHSGTIIDVPKGKGVRGISSILEEDGVIWSRNLFLLYVMSLGVQNRLKAGEYEFRKGETVSDIVGKLTSGDVLVHRVTVPEGLTLNEIAALLEKNGLFAREEFLAAAADRELLRGLPGPPRTGIEGYLFPETYTYTKGVTPEAVIKMMLDRFVAVYQSLDGSKNRVNLTDNEIIVLASIIEKETGRAEERPYISAVFHNRLKIGMRLESDPTVIYGIGDGFDGNLRKDDLRTMTQYNTYIIRGLPPGPISNPGKDSIIAAMSPAPVDYLYFVSRGDGTHYFSRNYTDHREAVDKYQR